MSFHFTPLQREKNTKSSNIPLPSTYVSRTQSEVQLAIDVAVAERRDERMFHRIVKGIQDRHRQVKEKASTTVSTHSQSTPRTGHTDHVYANEVNSHECSHPFMVIANMVDTHQLEIGDTTNVFLDTTEHRQTKDYGDDELSRSIRPTILETCTCKNLFNNSTVSGKDRKSTRLNSSHVE